MSFRSNFSYTTLLASVRERAAVLADQTMSLRGRAAVGACGVAAMGALTLGSAAGAIASTGPSEEAGATPGVSADGKTDPGGDKAAGNYGGEKAQPTFASAKDVIKLAEKQVGISEGKGGNTKFHSWYVGSDAAKRTAERDGSSVKDYKGASWCDMFVSWVGEHTGAKGMGADAYTVSHAQWFKDNGQWGKKPSPGAVVFYAFNGSKSLGDIEHVGFVVKDNGNGTIKTIEGNSQNAVQEKVRPKGEVVGYGYPQYAKK